MPTPHETLNTDRRELLDLSLRNTLLNFRPLKAKGVEVVDELSRETYRILVTDGRKMTFAHVAAEEGAAEVEEVNGSPALLDQPEERESGGPAARHVDSVLQTPYVGKHLQRRLLNTYYAARTEIEEHGVNVLFLALGTLLWYESDESAEPRIAPLVLIPVELDRRSAEAKFSIGYNEAEVGSNLSLYHKVKTDFGFDLPIFEDSDELDIDAYLSQVERCVAKLNRWQVRRNDIQLGFFSFTKLLMFEDLEPGKWVNNGDGALPSVLSSLLGDGIEGTGVPQAASDRLDHLEAGSLHPIWDADSSQTQAIMDVLAGRNLVIQGPPGTGKSQTITNLIAEAAISGKTVLFVAEKMAALEVVKRRLDNACLGDLCLELHSRKSNKRAVLDDLRATMSLGQPQVGDVETDYRSLASGAQKLNDYCSELHSAIEPSSVTPYKAFGRMARLEREAGPIASRFVRLEGILEWEDVEFDAHMEAVSDLEEFISEAGVPIAHPYWGCGIEVVTPAIRADIGSALSGATSAVSELKACATHLAGWMRLDPPTRLRDVLRLAQSVERLSDAPRMAGTKVDHPAWLASLDFHGSETRNVRVMV